MLLNNHRCSECLNENLFMTGGMFWALNDTKHAPFDNTDCSRITANGCEFVVRR